MSFNEKKTLIDRYNKITENSGMLALLLWFVGSLPFSFHDSNDRLILLCWSLFIFLGYWAVYRIYLNKEVECESCGFSLAQIISVLPKTTNKGFCPQCVDVYHMISYLSWINCLLYRNLPFNQSNRKSRLLHVVIC